MFKKGAKRLGSLDWGGPRHSTPRRTRLGDNATMHFSGRRTGRSFPVRLRMLEAVLDSEYDQRRAQ
eukprot:8856917-Pyramimonas_sp.AAC.1